MIKPKTTPMKINRKYNKEKIEKLPKIILYPMVYTFLDLFSLSPSMCKSISTYVSKHIHMFLQM